MELKLQKRLAGDVMNCSPYRVSFDVQRLDDIKDAITKADIRALARQGAIIKNPVVGISKFRARKIKCQKRKGRRKGPGCKKGPKRSRLSKKRAWINRVRCQRRFLAELREKKLVSTKTAHMIYQKIKGGFFRSRRHVKLFLEEKKMFNK